MSAPPKDVIAKYLARYAEPECALGSRIEQRTRHVLVIPAHDESASLLEGIRPALDAVGTRGERTLCIVVVNATDAHDAPLLARNESLLSALKAHAPSVALHEQDETPCWYANAGHFDLVVIDRSSEGHRLPQREGVGMARKIGCDLALAALRAGANQAPLIHMSDGDVRLPSDYFDVTVPPSTAAVVYRFFHEPCGEPTIDEAHARYEAYLRYYILGLRHAASPYAYHSIGSCIATVPRAYATVRGVPKRQAGEDFYLLNKLAKVGRIHHADSSPVAIVARASLRVPFGTGRATHDIAKNVEGYRIYDPKVFELLKSWLAALQACDEAPAERAYEEVYERAGEALDPSDHARLGTALRAIGAPKALVEAAARTHSVPDRRKRLRDWFDAFRTLKLVHALRDGGLVDVPWREAIAAAPFCRSTAEAEAAEKAAGVPVEAGGARSFETCRRLAILEEHGPQVAS